MKTILLILFTWPLYAGAPVYTVLDQDTNSDRLNKASAKGVSGDEISFDLSSSNKSLTNESYVRSVEINGQTFKVGLQDEIDPTQSIPFFKVTFPKDSIDREIYVLAGPKGTSGASFHYFIKSERGKYIYSGLHPEITFDRDQQSFYSVEKDGPRAHITTWTLKDSRFVAQTTESVR